MEGNRTILNPPELQLTSARAIEKKPQVFSFGEHAATSVTRGRRTKLGTR